MRKFILMLIACGYLLISVQWAMGDTLAVYYFERPPYYFTDQGRATGFLIELVREILKDAGIEASYRMMPPKRIIAEIKDRKNFACSVGWFKTPEREEFANFALPIYQNRPIVALTTRHNKQLFESYTTLKEIFYERSLKVGIINSFSYGVYIDQLINDFSPEMEKVTGNQLQLIKMLSAGRITYMLIAPEEIEALVYSAGLRAESFVAISLSDIASGNMRYIMCSKGVDDNVIDRINLSIQKLVDSKNFK